MTQITQFPAPETAAQHAPVSDQKVQKETVLEYLKAYGFNKSLSAEEQNQFIQTALANDLNPFKREIHIAVYGEGANRKVSIITGYQNYLKRAERTGKLDGWRAWLEGEGQHMKAIVEIFRKDWSHSFTHEVYWEEAVQKKKDGLPTQFWAKQPRFQLRKVAVAQGFRLAFPDELGSLPYETAELPDNETAPVFTNVPNSVKTSTSSLAEQALDYEYPVTETAQQLQPPVTKTQSFSNNTELTQDERDRLVRQIEDLFEEHPEDFTGKHKNWILNNALKAADRTDIAKMVAYTEKVIRKASA